MISLAERRSQTRGLIDKLLAERRELLALLFDNTSDDAAVGDAGREHLKTFCDILIDYIAAGHFGLYQRLSEGTERRAAVLEAAKRAFPVIESVTEAALSFNDRCEADDYQRTDEITERFSALAEQLSTRFELEDEIIDAMLRPSPATSRS